MWKELMKIAPDLVPIIIQTVLDVEKVLSGIRRGEVRKARVMSVIGNILDTKDYFLARSPDGQMHLLNLVSIFIDYLVCTFNHMGVFVTHTKECESPSPEAQDE